MAIPEARPATVPISPFNQPANFPFVPEPADFASSSAMSRALLDPDVRETTGRQIRNGSPGGRERFQSLRGFSRKARSDALGQGQQFSQCIKNRCSKRQSSHFPAESESMRITFVLPGFNLTGGVRVIAIYADYLQKKGHQVLAVAPPEARPTWSMVFKSLVRGRGWPNVPWFYPSHFDQTAVEHRVFNHYGRLRASDILDADVIIAPWWETVRWLMDMPDSKGKRVHFMQGYEYWGGSIAEIDAVYRLPIPKIIIAEWMRGLLKDKFDRSPFAIVPNSVDATQFFAPERGK